MAGEPVGFWQWQWQWEPVALLVQVLEGQEAEGVNLGAQLTFSFLFIVESRI